MTKFKSNFERQVRKLLPKWIKYEVSKVHFKQPEKDRIYNPDWTVRDNVFIETKGKLDLATRQKHLWIKQQHPEITVYFLFMNAFNRITKKSKTTYADWAEANGFEWADFKVGIPLHWIKKL